MANITQKTPSKPIVIDKFLGLNIATTGDTEILTGQSGNMMNFYITNDYKLKKMYGYKCFYDFGTKPDGVFYTQIKNNKYLFVATNGSLFYFTEVQLNSSVDEWKMIEPKNIGTLTSDETRFFVFDDKLYILNGNEYKYWDGTGTIKDVIGYIPLVAISSTPSGGGTEFEEINSLNDKRHQTFNSDGTSKVYQLVEKNIASVDKVIINGNETTDYTVDLINGTITFATAPGPNGTMDNVDIYWSKGTNERDLIYKCRAGIIFGGATNTKVFLYGNKEMQNRVFFSGTAGQVPSAEYFPVFNFSDVGSKNFAVTDLRRHYDTLLVTTNKQDAYSLNMQTSTLPDERLQTTVSVLPLNESRGNVAFAQGQVIDNDPVTIDKGIIRWKNTNVRDERNMKEISERINSDLQLHNLENIKTLDYQMKSQLWLVSGIIVWIYNYQNDTFSRCLFSDEPSHLETVDNNVWFGTYEGKIMKTDENFQDYNGQIINAHWESGFMDFQVEHLRKTMTKLWITLQPQYKTSCMVSYLSNRNASAIKKQINYSVLLFEEINFSNFSFKISNEPQVFRLKMKAKKFTNLKILLDNNDDTDCTVLSLDLKIIAGGESK